MSPAGAFMGSFMGCTDALHQQLVPFLRSCPRSKVVWGNSKPAQQGSPGLELPPCWKSSSRGGQSPSLTCRVSHRDAPHWAGLLERSVQGGAGTMSISEPQASTLSCCPQLSARMEAVGRNAALMPRKNLFANIFKSHFLSSLNSKV